MSRLDAEYDPAEHHDLMRIDEYPPRPRAFGHDPESHVAVCYCGWVDQPGQRDRSAAYRAWDGHRHEEMFHR